MQLAVDAGARVIATAGSAEKLALCVDLGAEIVVDYTRDDFGAVAMEATGQRGVDVVFDNVGAAVMPASMNCLAYNGRYLMVGFASDKAVADEPFVVPRRLAMGNFRLCGVLLAYAPDEAVGPMKAAIGANFVPAGLGTAIHEQVLERILPGRVRTVVGRVAAFADLPEAIEAMASRRTSGRVILAL